jgi:hypothetical protein
MSAASGSTEMQILNVETQSADAPKRKFSWADVKSRITLETVVIALIVCAIIVFTSFQISESVTAHQEPSTKVSILEKARLFPGMLICPYGRNRLAVFNGVERQGDDYDPNPFCPQWTDDAFMSFEFGASSNPFTSYKNVTPDFQNFNTVGTQKKPLFYLGSATRYATIKNKPVLQKIVRDTCLQKNPGNTQRCLEDACDSWAPPNVRCIVYDPFEFDKSENADPTLNPMRETIANGIDSLSLPDVSFDLKDTSYLPTQGFRYSGLIKQPAFSPVFGEDVPSNAFISLFDYRELLRKKILGNQRILQTSLFSGVMLVFYNPFNGIPKELDFTSAPQIFGSDLFTVGLLKSGEDRTKPRDQADHFDVRKEDSRAVSVSVHFHQAYSDAVRGAYREPKASYSFSSTPILKDDFARKSGRGGDSAPILDVKFVSGVSTFTQDVVSLSVLTSISIILTTSATLWGSQEKIKEFILFCIAKYSANRKAHLSDKDTAN